MQKKSFEEQYPGYKIIPEKKAKIPGPVITVVTIVLMVGTVGLLFQQLSKLQVPMPNIVGINAASLNTLAHLATYQASSGELDKAVRSFKNYFALGGADPAVMMNYAASLNAIGQKREALEWYKKAAVKDPASKAGLFIQEMEGESK